MLALYVDKSQATAWCTQRGHQEWNELQDGQKEASLIKAAEWIDRLYRFRGSPDNPAQIRAWPRRDALRDDGTLIAGIPPEVKDATLMLAVGFAQSEEAAEELLGTASRIKQEKAGSIEVQYETLPYRYRSKISRILNPVLAPPMQGQLRRG